MGKAVHSLKISHNQNPVDEFVLRHELITIGRNFDNDIHVSDSTVSGHHARIVMKPDYRYIEDLGSTNGTFVNGERIKRHPLRTGDRISIGKHLMIFASEHETSDIEEHEPTLQLSNNAIPQLDTTQPVNRGQIRPASNSNSNKVINWVAQDENGIWWGFESEPTASPDGWSSFQETMQLKLKTETPNPDWQKTLHKI